MICLRRKVDVTAEEMNIAEIPCAVRVGDLLQDVGYSALCWIERFYLRQIAAYGIGSPHFGIPDSCNKLTWNGSGRSKCSVEVKGTLPPDLDRVSLTFR
jgi:hypothetical protein